VRFRESFPSVRDPLDHGLKTEKGRVRLEKERKETAGKGIPRDSGGGGMREH